MWSVERLAGLVPAEDGVKKARAKVLDYLEQHGATSKTRLRSKLDGGYNANVLTAIDELLAEHRIHYERCYVSRNLASHRHSQRQQNVLALGRLDARQPLSSAKVRKLLNGTKSLQRSWLGASRSAEPSWLLTQRERVCYSPRPPIGLSQPLRR